MKKIVPIVLSLLFLTSCTVKEYTPRIPDLYKCNITVYSGDFYYDGEFCKNYSLISVTVTSTRASGLEMIFDGKTLTMNYGGYDYQLDGTNFEKTNSAILLYQAFSCLENGETQNEKTDDGYAYTGITDLGDFILFQHDDETFKSLKMKNIDYEIIFKNNKE